MKAGRRRGSAIFDPYYKIQWRDPVSMSWRDVQKAYEAPEDAYRDYLPGKLCRLMEITMAGRSPVQGSERL